MSSTQLSVQDLLLGAAVDDAISFIVETLDDNERHGRGEGKYVPDMKC